MHQIGTFQVSRFLLKNAKNVEKAFHVSRVFFNCQTVQPFVFLSCQKWSSILTQTEVETNLLSSSVLFGRTLATSGSVLRHFDETARTETVWITEMDFMDLCLRFIWISNVQPLVQEIAVC